MRSCCWRAWTQVALQATRRQDVAAAIDTLEHFAGWADKLAGEVIPVRNDALTFSRAPRSASSRRSCRGLPVDECRLENRAGACLRLHVVLKPAQLTPLSALWLGRPRFKPASRQVS